MYYNLREKIMFFHMDVEGFVFFVLIWTKVTNHIPRFLILLYRTSSTRNNTFIIGRGRRSFSHLIKHLFFAFSLLHINTYQPPIGVLGTFYYTLSTILRYFD